MMLLVLFLTQRRRLLRYLSPPVYGPLRLTVPAQELIAGAGNDIAWAGEIASAPTYTVTLRRPPSGLTLVLIGLRADQHRGLRLESEPEYPGEWQDGAGITWWERGDWTPCPECGAALLWCEAGFVPGWRICLAGHASQLSSDGRSAAREKVHDAAARRATYPLR